MVNKKYSLIYTIFVGPLVGFVCTFVLVLQIIVLFSKNTIDVKIIKELAFLLSFTTLALLLVFFLPWISFNLKIIKKVFIPSFLAGILIALITMFYIIRY